jgi:hypothetical protein
MRFNNGHWRPDSVPSWSEEPIRVMGTPDQKRAAKYVIAKFVSRPWAAVTKSPTA